MSSPKRTARLAGLLYLLMGLPAPFVLLYVPNRLLVRGDASATAQAIRGHQTLFEWNIFGHLWNLVFFLFVATTLYRLLQHVHPVRATLMVNLVLVSLPISFLSLLADVGILVLLQGGQPLGGLGDGQIESLVYFLFVMRGKIGLVAQVFWGLWLIPFGLLVTKSGFLPRLLGILLIVNGVAYPLMSLVGLFFPAFYGVVFNAAMPALLGELWVQLWLLVRGVREMPADRDGQPALGRGAALSP